MLTRARTRWGCLAASSTAHQLAWQWETTTASDVSVASITATASPTLSALVWDAGSVGRPDLPLPRPSIVTRRKHLLRKGIWPLKMREWVIGDGGMKSRVGPSWSYTS
jgi:hypothetical protein